VSGNAPVPLLHSSLRRDPTRRHIDIRLLPSLVPEEYRNDTARIIVPELTARIAKLRDLIDAGVIDQEITNGLFGASFERASRWTLIMFLQMTHQTRHARSRSMRNSLLRASRPRR
jgi:hypothetical protein